MDQCSNCREYISIFETNVGKHNEDLCNKCFKEQNQTLTDIQLAAKIQFFAHDIYYGKEYPLESLDRLIALGEAAKKFKELN